MAGAVWREEEWVGLGVRIGGTFTGPRSLSPPKKKVEDARQNAVFSRNQKKAQNGSEPSV